MTGLNLLISYVYWTCSHSPQDDPENLYVITGNNFLTLQLNPEPGISLYLCSVSSRWDRIQVPQLHASHAQDDHWIPSLIFMRQEFRFGALQQMPIGIQVLNIFWEAVSGHDRLPENLHEHTGPEFLLAFAAGLRT